MWESPIEIIKTDIQTHYEEKVMEAVLSCGINVNKEELIKALQYDRQQYEKGYEDAKAKQQWIPCSERLPEEEYVLISKKPTKISGDKWCVTVAIRITDPRSGKINWRDIGFGVIPDDNVLAWMPRPKPYQEKQINER